MKAWLPTQHSPDKLEIQQEAFKTRKHAKAGAFA